MGQNFGRTSVMRSPPARRSRSPYYRSAGHRRFGLRTTLSRGMWWSSRFERVPSFILSLLHLTWMNSSTVGMSRSTWIIALVIYTYKLESHTKNKEFITAFLILLKRVLHKIVVNFRF